MLEFQHPGFLLLLLLLPLLAWRPRLRGGRPSLAWPGVAALRSRSWRVLLAPLPGLLSLLGLALCIVALARPQLTWRESVVKSQGIDILLVLDTSGSMDSADFQVNGRDATRMMVARSTLAAFVEGRPHDRLGLVVFGEEAFTQVPLTLDHDTLTDFISQLQIGMAGANATAIGRGLAVATAHLSKLDAPSKVIVLVTDGRDNAAAQGLSITPLQAAEAARALGVRIYTIGVGAAGGGGGFFSLLGGARDEVDEATLKKVAEVTGARYFRATDTQTMTGIFAQIDQLETSTAEVKEYVRREELYHRALLPGIGALVLGAVLSSTTFRRLP